MCVCVCETECVCMRRNEVIGLVYIYGISTLVGYCCIVARKRYSVK